MTQKRTLLLLIVACLQWSSAAAQTPQSYGSYYQKNIKESGGQFRGLDTNNYLFDRYYKHSSSVSPYASLNRGRHVRDPFTQVRAEQQRRATFQSGMRSYVSQRKQQGNVGHTDYGFALQLQRGTARSKDIPSTRKPTPYYNQWYGK